MVLHRSKISVYLAGVAPEVLGAAVGLATFAAQESGSIRIFLFHERMQGLVDVGGLTKVVGDGRERASCELRQAPSITGYGEKLRDPFRE